MKTDELLDKYLAESNHDWDFEEDEAISGYIEKGDQVGILKGYGAGLRGIAGQKSGTKIDVHFTDGGWGTGRSASPRIEKFEVKDLVRLMTNADLKKAIARGE